MKILVSLGAMLLVSACAIPAGKIQPEVTSGLQYEGWKCSLLEQEGNLVDARLAAATRVQNRAATTDAISVLLIGLPLSGGGAPDQIAQLKGRRLALDEMFQRRACQ